MKKFLLLILLSFSSVADQPVDAGIIGKTSVFTRHPLGSPNRKLAEDFRVGDTVLSTVDEEGSIKHVPVRITAISKRKTKQVVFIRTENGQLLADPEERFFSCTQKKWVKAKYLTKDHDLANLQGREVELEEVQQLTLLVPAEMYNFTLEMSHLFYIADSSGEALLIHNEPTTLMALYLAGIGVKTAVVAGTSVPIILTTSTTVPVAVGITGALTAPILVAAPFVALGAGVGAGCYYAYKGFKSFFHHEKCKKRTRRRAAQVYNAPEMANPPAIVKEIQKTAERLAEVDKLVDKVRELDKKRPRRGGPGPKEEEKKLNEINYKHNHKNSRQLKRGHRSSKKQLDEHVKKLKDYVKDPDKHDHLGKLKGASQAQRTRVINRRANHLMDEIKEAVTQCEDIQNALEYLELML